MLQRQIINSTTRNYQGSAAILPKFGGKFEHKLSANI